MEEINSKAEKTAMEKERNAQRTRSHAAHETACPANFPELNGPASLAGAGKKPLQRRSARN